MSDQARQLRELAIQNALRGAEHEPARRAVCVQFCSGSASAGTAALSLNIAMALARWGLRSMWVATPCADVHQDPFPSLFEPLAEDHGETLGGRLSVGPFGLTLLVPNTGGADRVAMKRVAEFILIDAGYQTGQSEPQNDDTIVYITTTDNAAVLDTYALMKSHRSRGPAFAIANQAESEAEGWEALERFCAASGDFSQRRIIPATVLVKGAARQLNDAAHPVVLQSPTSAIARQLEAFAERLVELSPVAHPLVSSHPDI